MSFREAESWSHGQVVMVVICSVVVMSCFVVAVTMAIAQETWGSTNPSHKTAHHQNLRTETDVCKLMP